MRRGATMQLVVSLLVAAAIVAVTVAVVTARIGAGTGEEDRGGNSGSGKQEQRRGED
jgi:hypothetical protein